MRYVPYVLCVGLLLSLPVAPSAVAQIGGGETCTKGIFWPFVREQGDCLTDVERANGRTGVYQDPDAPPAAAAAPAFLPTPADPAAPANPAPPANSASAPTVSAPGPVLTGSAETPLPVSSGAVSSGPVSSGPTSTAPAAGPVLDENNCRKGLWWPFVREAGDCLTDVERANGRQGTYQ